MNVWQLASFAGIYIIAVGTPGPGIAALVARVLQHGLHGLGLTGLTAMIGGFILGDLIWFGLAVAGLAVLAQNFVWIFLVIKYAGAAYLIYLAWQAWFAPAKAIETGKPVEIAPSRLFLSILSLTLGNPKVMVFFLSIMPLVVDMHQIDLHVALVLAAVIAASMGIVLGSYALLAHRARSLLKSVLALKRLNRGVAVILFAAATLIATR